VPRYLRWDELPENHRNYGEEPDSFELGWQVRDEHDRLVTMDRLASPLVVKALPLAGKRFAPCALWLHRAYPDGKVGLVRKRGNDRVIANGTEASFDALVAPGDAQHFAPLRGKASLRDAFLDWLHANYKTTKVSPP
jgi:CRISPR-associated protein Cmr1